MTKRYLAPIIILLLMTLQSGRAAAQFTAYYAASYDPAAQTISFYTAVDTTFTQIGSVSAGFEENSPFRLLVTSRVALSPDGQHVALVGQDTTITSASPVYQLRIFNLATQQLTIPQPIPLPSVSILPTWSPNGQFLLVKPTDAYFDPPPIPENFVYSLRDGVISTPVDTPNQLDILFWTPNNQLLYDNRTDARQTLTTISPSTASLTGSSAPLLNVDVNAGNDFSCQFAWSPYNNRWYFSVGCAGDGSGVESIYSFSNARDVRLEVRLRDYVEDFPGAAQIRDIQIMPTGVYVLTPWPSRVIRIGYDGTIVPFPQGSEFSAAYLQISPNGQLVAFYSRRGGLTLNTLTSGETRLNSTINSLICDMRWLDDTRLIYSTFDSGQCIFDNFGLPTGIRVWDTTSNTFTSPLGDSSWLLPMPYSD
jgi:hypothetical protein